MPELPEVASVRVGLEPHVLGRTFTEVEVLRDRAVRRQPGGAPELANRLIGRTVLGLDQRGKYLWAVLDDDSCLLIHLGMSGQIIVPEPGESPGRHERVRFTLDNGVVISFRDQRTFGWVWACDLVPALTGGGRVPAPAVHIAPSLIDESVDPVTLAHQMRRRTSGIKRVLLNQEVVSGIGNIYADEMLWAARVHGEKPADEISVRKLAELVRAGRGVMDRAIEAGGTSFDALYVHVNGESGYFSRSLEVYGREGERCSRCDGIILRKSFMNRSSYMCTKCQRL
ncbi:bifunctional DNA-formamidopyrimidine glycosylase/DNA-(apurinic or apyrimidinic site) lyase [Corynebacterium sputi]|uniref:bifunctional DNA-formamidopyrimidine glycosylase/DNA-(apurinic or apyrimidinic site) lyase n=1 Tax=Corynebacterium sputi TaxID=489915 RepID=UPI000478DCF0|nr:bifunctional DNA-formamidopyrimidine glycosylase/DNA-(apurinic or apyrimidinic site) lyase [Corynebacterium sputi]